MRFNTTEPVEPDLDKSKPWYRTMEHEEWKFVETYVPKKTDIPAPLFMLTIEHKGNKDGRQLVRVKQNGKQRVYTFDPSHLLAEVPVFIQAISSEDAISVSIDMGKIERATKNFEIVSVDHSKEDFIALGWSDWKVDKSTLAILEEAKKAPINLDWFFEDGEEG